MEGLRVLIVADDPLVRTGLATALEGQIGYLVAGQVGWEPDVASAIELHQPDVLLWDTGWDSPLPDDRLAELISLRVPAVLLISGDAVAEEAWAAGARGLLLRDAETPQLLATLAATTQGLVTVDPSLAAVVRRAGDEPSVVPAEELTRRELEVLRLLAEGLPNKSIADALNISDHTVKFHLSAVYGKLGVQSRTEAVTRATRLGLILL